jgi:succinate dehydrogenase / fumarate reductase iron-sulfur subunit
MAGSGTETKINLTLNVWRQKNRKAAGRFETYPARDISTDMSFLEMLDVVNERLILEGKDPIAFDHDCREGICGQCGVVINGEAHGPRRATTTCQLHMRSFMDGDVLTIEPWRATAFPVVKDLMVDRSAFDRIIAAGGFISVRTGNAPEANDMPVPKEDAEQSMDAAACIGCGACVAACPNASAMLFVAAKAGHLNTLPQGKPEQARRATAMIDQMDAEGFGSCTNHGECEAVCPKEIRIEFIGRLNRDYLRASLRKEREAAAAGAV